MDSEVAGTVVPLAKALVRLRELTLLKMSEATGIRIQNISAWLRGRPGILSAKRIVLLMHHLGIHGGNLRQDMVHQWKIRGGLEDLRLVLSKTVGEQQLKASHVFRDSSTGYRAQRLLRIPDPGGTHIFIRLTLEPSLTEGVQVTASTIGCEGESSVAWDLSELPDTPALVDEWLKENTGIKDERVSQGGKLTEDMDYLFFPDFSDENDWSKPLSGVERLRAEILRSLHAGASYDDMADVLHERFSKVNDGQ